MFGFGRRAAMAARERARGGHLVADPPHHGAVSAAPTSSPWRRPSSTRWRATVPTGWQQKRPQGSQRPHEVAGQLLVKMIELAAREGCARRRSAACGSGRRWRQDVAGAAGRLLDLGQDGPARGHAGHAVEGAEVEHDLRRGELRDVEAALELGLVERGGAGDLGALQREAGQRYCLGQVE
jgi:hypothetical protein